MTQEKQWPGWKPWIASKGCDVVCDPISRMRMPVEWYVECRFCRELIHARDLPPGTSVEEPPDACPACGKKEREG